MRRLVKSNSSGTSRGLLVQWYYIAQPILTIASRSNLILLGTFITLLQAVAFTSEDREALKKLWERLKWQLRIFSRGNELFEGALKRLDHKRTWVESILEKGFTPVSPVKPSREESNTTETCFPCSARWQCNQWVSRFPDSEYGGFIEYRGTCGSQCAQCTELCGWILRI